MTFSRREFVKGSLASLGFLALPGGLWAAPAGWKPKKKPNLVFGVVSDTHMRCHYDGERFYSHGNPDSRVYGYNVVVAGEDGTKLKKSVYARGYCMGIGHEPEGGVTTWRDPYGSPRNLNDYARREYAGLLRAYYQKRWEALFNCTDAEGNFDRRRFGATLNALTLLAP